MQNNKLLQNHQLNYFHKQNLISITPPLRVEIGDCKWGMFKIRFMSTCNYQNKFPSQHAQSLDTSPHNSNMECCLPSTFNVSVRNGSCLTKLEALDTALGEQFSRLNDIINKEGLDTTFPSKWNLTYKPFVSRKSPYPDSIRIGYRRGCTKVYIISSTNMNRDGKNSVVVNQCSSFQIKEYLKSGTQVACVAQINNLRINSENMTVTPMLHAQHIVLDPELLVGVRYASANENTQYAAPTSIAQKRKFTDVDNWSTSTGGL